MRKITQAASHAFYHGYNFKRGNTRVVHDEDGTAKLYLHGNLIATKHWLIGVSISDGGWQTPTTKERLHGVIGPGRIRQHNWQWYLDGLAWGGNPTSVEV